MSGTNVMRSSITTIVNGIVTRTSVAATPTALVPIQNPVKKAADAVSTRFNQPAVYLAYIGQYDGEHLYKFGKSRRFQRRFMEHLRTYPQFKPVAVEPCANHSKVESQLMQELRLRGLLRKRAFEGVTGMRTELCALQTAEDVDAILAIIRELIEASQASGSHTPQASSSTSSSPPSTASPVVPEQPKKEVVDMERLMDELEKLKIDLATANSKNAELEEMVGAQAKIIALYEGKF
jgi:hypothetical protein